ncbi:Protein CHROMATIN REMODELING 35, variant 2 [Lathyrus oleraceus]|uniref:Protein CHROMATIN REMODELING 35, variant 2 n=1 Tax=Pisum sativum TaxID=3888 RepID=A0A9D5GZ55_PEA|nr:Protein CHROMATIN REMODELING 35, variant 2 [Pisum sativum]
MDSPVDLSPAKRSASTGTSSEEGGKKLRLSSGSLTHSHVNAVDYKNLHAISDRIDCSESRKFGSVTKDIEALMTQRMQILSPYFSKYPRLANPLLKAVTNHDEETHNSESKKVTSMSHENVMGLERGHIEKDVLTPRKEMDVPAAPTVVIIDSDEEDDRDQKYFLPFQKVVLPKPVQSPALKTIGYHVPIAYHKESADLKFETSLHAKDNTQKYKDVYVGVHEKVDNKVDAEDERLEDVWREMYMAIETSKDVSADHPPEEEEGKKDADCDHSFVLKDDLGYVCRVCGVIDRGIETIFEFQYKVKRSTRTYMSESWNGKAKDDIFEAKIAEDDLTVTEISAHPRHANQMKLHQVEGFNFLVRNLVGDHPGGCILAHAPGSGKTFMIISFIQSFLGKYPSARPLVVLPKGILSTWKKEFQTWQVEDVPLYDFYSVKAESRSQQLEVLKQWVDHKSILFLGYRQFTSIVCDNCNNNVSISCQDILLKVPSILILDEGHTPRNENTDTVQSLARVQTPRKVVLSGTLYQNHVKEVFNVLNLVRPKFKLMESSKPIVRRIKSRIHIPGVNDFCDLVENTLQKDPDFKRKVAVIHDLREMTSKVLHYYKGDFLDELPGLVDFTVVLKLTPRQMHELDKVKRIYGKFKMSSVGSAVYLHPKLKPIAEKCGENSISDDIIDDLIANLDVRDGVKLKFFRNMLNLCESAGEKLLVFSQYLLPLKCLERLAMKWKGWSVGKEIFVISGASSTEEREFSMEKFNGLPEAKIFFGSIRACGEGISLVGASRVIILDVHLNPSVTRQAIGRAFRPGQKRKVFVYRLIAADSPEEEDHNTCFKKELISKMWFEWNEYCGDRAFEVETLDVKECGDLFLESPLLGEDVKALHKR